jgi:hypothetical protein
MGLSIPEEISHQFIGESFSDRGTLDHQEDLQKHPYKYDEPVVTSHGKTCLWCDHEGMTEPPKEYEEHEHPDEEHEHQDEDNVEDPDYHQGSEPDDPQLEGLPVDQIPPLLYRCYDSGSQGVNSRQGFLSGLFASGVCFKRKQINDEKFEEHFRNHVSPKKILTPFISTFRSPLAPLQRASRSLKIGTIAVIDTKKIRTEVFYAHPIAKYTRSFTFSWRGKGEFLIWGQVPGEAVIFTINFSTLERVAISYRDINRLLQLSILRSTVRCNKRLRDHLAAKRKSPYRSGRAFGKLLSLVKFPTLHWEHAAHWFTNCWGWICSKEVVEFMRGLKSEFPYVDEELSDSENEVCLITPKQTPHKSCANGELPSQSLTESLTESENKGYLITPQQTPENPKTILNLRLQSSTHSDSDEAYEPLNSEEDIERSSEEDGSRDVEMDSVSLENKTETIDDGHFSTHESLSSFDSSIPNRCEHDTRDHQQMLGGNTSNQRNLWYRHSSETEVCVHTLCPISVVIPTQPPYPSSIALSREEEMSDVLIYENGSWNQLQGE